MNPLRITVRAPLPLSLVKIIRTFVVRQLPAFGEALVLVALVAAPHLALADHTRTELSVDVATVIQPDFLGVNAIYHGFAFMPEQIEKGMNDQDRAREFDRVQRIGLNIARTWYRPNYTSPNSLTESLDWNSVRMQAFYRWLQVMKDQNVDVALQLGWWFTRDTHFGNATVNPDKDPERFAAWVSESLHQIIEVRGFTNVKYGILFTESTQYETGPVPAGYTQWSYYSKFVRVIHERLVKDHRRSLVKLVGPNNSTDALNLADAVRELNDVIDIYSGHEYGKDYQGWSDLADRMRRIVAPTGKPYWIDEWGKQDEAYRQTPDYGTYVAEGIAAFLNAGAQTALNWILFDQQYIAADGSVGNTKTSKDSFHSGVHRWGFTKWPHDTISEPTLPYPSWYAFSLLSKHLGGRHGAKVYKAQGADGVQIAAVQSATGEWSFLVINTNAITKAIHVKPSAALHAGFQRYLYDPARVIPTEAATLIEADLRFEKDHDVMDSLPPRSMAIYRSQPVAAQP